MRGRWQDKVVKTVSLEVTEPVGSTLPLITDKTDKSRKCSKGLACSSVL